MRSAVAVLLLAATAVSADSRPWMNAMDPVNTRVNALLAQMTSEEKINQILHLWTTFTDKAIIATYANTSVGAAYIQAISANTTCNMDLVCRTQARNNLQQSIVSSSRLGIPMTFVAETLHSVFSSAKRGARGGRRVGAENAKPVSTIFPMPNLQGASWNTSLVEQIAATVALETRAAGCDRGFSPEIQVTVDPRFGRMQENFGADPTLVAAFAVAALHGLSDGGGPSAYLENFETKIISEAKHFAAYGFGDHDGAPADVSIPLLYDVYLRPWAAYVKAGGRGAMAAHNSVNNQPCHSSKWLLTSVFREELGCRECLIGSDFDDIVNLQNVGTANVTKYPGLPGPTDASLQALSAGLDQDLGGYSYTSLTPAYAAKLVNETDLDRATANVLRTKFAAGLFDQPLTNMSHLARVHAQEHIDLARFAVANSVVLLQNTNNVLPIGPGRGLKFAVIGPNAGCPGNASYCSVSENMVGAYSPFVGPGQVVTVLDAITEYAAKTGGEVLYQEGVDINTDDVSRIPAAVQAAQQSDYVIAVMGDDTTTCGEGLDRVELDLPGSQLDLIQQVLATGKPMVIVLVSGRTATFGEGKNSKYGPWNSLVLNPASKLAIVEAWRPGEQGGPGILDVLLGNQQPVGRLAQPFPQGSAFLHTYTTPWFHLRQEDYMPNGVPRPSIDGGEYLPLWCFGHGLGYTAFNMTRVAANATMFSPNDSIRVTASYSLFAGALTGGPAETLQVYFAQLATSAQARNTRNLAGFAKEWMLSNTQDITVTFPVHDLGYTTWDAIAGTHQHVVEPGQYLLLACFSSCNCPLNTTVTITA